MYRAASLLVSLALAGAAPIAPASGWHEIDWPFARDAWPAGRAFRCRDCDLQVSVRPKLGFCNCTRGVTDDAEVDAVSDIDSITPDFAALEPGEPLQAAGLHGRARQYSVQTRVGPFAAAGYALSSGCDLLVVAALGRNAGDRTQIVQLLQSEPLATWIAAQLGRAPPRPTGVTAPR